MTNPPNLNVVMVKIVPLLDSYILSLIVHAGGLWHSNVYCASELLIYARFVMVRR